MKDTELNRINYVEPKWFVEEADILLAAWADDENETDDVEAYFYKYGSQRFVAELDNIKKIFSKAS